MQNTVSIMCSIVDDSFEWESNLESVRELRCNNSCRLWIKKKDPGWSSEPQSLQFDLYYSIIPSKSYHFIGIVTPAASRKRLPRRKPVISIVQQPRKLCQWHQSHWFCKFFWFYCCNVGHGTMELISRQFWWQASEMILTEQLLSYQTLDLIFVY